MTTLPIYPDRDLIPGLTYGQKWSPAFFNQSVTTATGADIDIGLSPYPLHDFELDYEYVRDRPRYGSSTPKQSLEFRTFMGFYLSIGGSVGRFLYKNIDDCQVWQNSIGDGDGSTTAFTLTRTFGAQGYFATEPVGQVDLAAGVNVYLDGSATPVDPNLYTISTTTPGANTITFGTAPAADYNIAVDMSYFYYCKFPKDTNTFEKFMDRLWNSTVQLHSCRAGA